MDRLIPDFDIWRNNPASTNLILIGSGSARMVQDVRSEIALRARRQLCR
jgi:hypothetical protein